MILRHYLMPERTFFDEITALEPILVPICYMASSVYPTAPPYKKALGITAKVEYIEQS